MHSSGDTIVAVATPPGRGGIGVVRLSGAEARRIAETLVRLRHPLAAGRARFAEVVESGSGAVLDEAVVTFFAAPNSYTSEDVVEIAAHGSPVLLDWLLRQSVEAGARLAEPGEFTQRAFLAGRLDLTQAEAVHGLIGSTTLEQARTAARQMGGGLSKQVQPVKQRLIDLIAALEAGIDFAEDDLDLMDDGEITRKVREIEGPLRRLEESFAYGRVLGEGFRLAIVGRPNAGKSSLFNRLIGRDRAIVTAQPGTTRDPVAERVDIEGIPVELIDTAGLRTTTDEAEAQGIARSREAMAEADVVLVVVAANENLHEEDIAAVEAVEGRGLVVAVNKIDLVKEPVAASAALERIFRWCGCSKSRFPSGMTNKGHSGMTNKGHSGMTNKMHLGMTNRGGATEVVAVATSAKDGTGIAELRRAILGGVRAVPDAADTVPVTNLRQHGAVRAALEALQSAQAGVGREVPHEMLLLDLYACLQALDGLTGTTHTDEILNLIFSSFCIGK